MNTLVKIIRKKIILSNYIVESHLENANVPMYVQGTVFLDRKTFYKNS